MTLLVAPREFKVAVVILDHLFDHKLIIFLMLAMILIHLDYYRFWAMHLLSLFLFRLF
jgi:hypothetical protein